MNYTVERVKKGFRARIGKPYRFWQSDSVWNVVQAMIAPWDRAGYNCSAVFNSVFGEMKDEGYLTYPIGGTGDYNGALQVWEEFNLQKNYPPGTFLVTPYASPSVQGHLSMVYTSEDKNRDQWMMQSDAADGVSADGLWGWPGPNDKRSMYETVNNIDWPTWAGLLPAIPVLDKFPGYKATAHQVVQWYQNLCVWWNNMPLIIPINCIAAELALVLDKNRAISIWNIPGYSSAVDHDSYGQHQQRAIYYPFPWNFETSAYSFMTAVDKELGTDPYPNPDDDKAVGELIQQVQKSAYPDAYRQKYEWARKVIDETLGEEKPVSKKEPGYIAIDRDRWLRADGPDWSRGWYEVVEGKWMYKSG